MRAIIRMVERDGWYLARWRGGSHMQFKHPAKTGVVTIPCHSLSAELPRGTLAHILRQAQLPLRP